MKTIFSVLSVLSLSVLLHAQTEPMTASAYTPADLDRLLAPIALYPDALVALVLPASTEPSDVVLAARYLDAGGDPSQVDNQPWNDSVKALAHYPEVVKWMDANLEWTKSVGAAFLQQPADVMKAIQRLRAQARSAGTLVDTPQQDVVMEDGNICIVPAQPDVIYVPEYDPDVVYEQQTAYAGPWLTFGAGWGVGTWLNYECDWAGFGIRTGSWRPGWDWRRPHFTGNAGRPWRPDPDRERELHRHFDQPHPVIPRPKLMPGAPSIPHRPGGNFRPDNDDKKAWQPDNRGAVPHDFDHRGPADRQPPQPPSNPGRPAAVTPKPPPPPAGLPNNYNRGGVPPGFDRHEQESHQPVPNQNRPAAVTPKPPPPPPAGLPDTYNRGAPPRDFNNHEQEKHQPPPPGQGRPAVAPVRPPPPSQPQSKQSPPPSQSDKDKDQPPH